MWYDAEYSVKPDEIDKISSSRYVYLRKNITEVKKEFNNTSETVYTCREQLIPKSDWELYEKLLSHDTELGEVQDALIELSGIISEG